MGHLVMIMALTVKRKCFVSLEGLFLLLGWSNVACLKVAARWCGQFNLEELCVVLNIIHLSANISTPDHMGGMEIQ